MEECVQTVGLTCTIVPAWKATPGLTVRMMMISVHIQLHAGTMQPVPILVPIHTNVCVLTSLLETTATSIIVNN